MQLSEELKLPPIEIYCDGSSHARRGKPGGWGYVIVYKGREIARGSGSLEQCTNNTAELTAAIEGLLHVAEVLNDSDVNLFSRPIKLISDSMYVVNAANRTNIAVKNKEMVQNLQDLCVAYSVVAEWVKGHNGHEWNTLADKLATEAKNSFLVSQN
jgi:ribonuclease HI